MQDEMHESLDSLLMVSSSLFSDSSRENTSWICSLTSGIWKKAFASNESILQSGDSSELPLKKNVAILKEVHQLLN